jgi:hypothetical protein
MPPRFGKEMRRRLIGHGVSPETSFFLKRRAEIHSKMPPVEKEL